MSGCLGVSVCGCVCVCALVCACACTCVLVCVFLVGKRGSAKSEAAPLRQAGATWLCGLESQMKAEVGG